MTIENISRSNSTKVLGPARTHDPCISNRPHHRLHHRAQPLGFIFYLNWLWIYKFSFCSIWLLWSLLIAGPKYLVYQSGAYEAFTGVLVNKGKWHLLQGNRGRKIKFWGEQIQYMTKFPESFMDRKICLTESFPTLYFTLPDINPVISAASTDKSERKDLCTPASADLDLNL